MARILKMNDVETLKFLELYQNEPVLWDPTRGDYKKRESRAAAARRIAAEMKIEGFTEIHVITKFKNLRSSYSQELNKISKTMKSGCSSDDVYKPKVIWFQLMDSFLQPHVKSRNTQSNLEDQNVNNSIEKSTLSQNDDICIFENDPETASSLLNEIQSSTSKAMEGETEPLPKRKLMAHTPTVSRTKKILFTPVGNDVTSAIEKLDEISKRAATTSVLKEDSLDHFGRYVSSVLRSMPQERSTELQTAIVSLILKPPFPTYSRSCSRNQDSHNTANFTTFESDPPSVENLQSSNHDSVFSAEDTQHNFVFQLSSAMNY